MRNMTNTLKSISGQGLAIHGRLVMNVDSLNPHTSDLECCRWAGSAIFCVLSAVLNLLRRNNKEHSGRIMAVVRLYIENIQNLENISAVIEKLGKIGA